MGLDFDYPDEPNSTPRLFLSKLPCKTRGLTPAPMLTPPLHPSVSIPFQWEEVPGKPILKLGGESQPSVFSDSIQPPISKAKAKAVRCLDLPPRLLNDDGKMTVIPSPTNVLDGPYVGRSMSLACTFSFRKGHVKKSSGPGNLGSGRWGSFKEERKSGRGSLDFLMSEESDDFKSVEKKTRGVKRRRSFFTMNSSLWADNYASFKQAVPWRHRR